MAERKSDFSDEEIVQRGTEIYSRLRATLEMDHRGQIVAIDVGSRKHAVGSMAISASKKLRESCPQAVIWAVRIGEDYLCRI